MIAAVEEERLLFGSADARSRVKRDEAGEDGNGRTPNLLEGTGGPLIKCFIGSGRRRREQL